MDAESYWRVIGSERRGLAELLASLTDEQWETPSLCADWRVRDVAAHVALVPTAPGLLALIGGVVKVGGNPNRYNHDLAVRHASTGSPQPMSIGRSGPAKRSAAPSALNCCC